jgi:GPH family glycoside/pentoside/hexuronide:cation symporter
MSASVPAVPPSHRIPLTQKIAYGVGMLGNQMFPAILAVFMVVLVQGLGFPGLLLSLVGFLPRLLDAVTDPVMGFVTDNTKSRFGRRRPYIFIGAILTGIAYMLMWQLYPEKGVTYNFWYFLVFSFVFYIGLTIFATPYVAMGYEMSDDFHERTRLMAVSQWIGQLAWVIVPWSWVIIYNTNIFETPADGVRSLSIWVGFGCMLLALTPAIFCATQPVDESKLQKLSLSNLGANIGSLVRGFKQSLALKPFRQICVATFLVFGAFNTIAGLSWFIIVHYMYAGDAGPDGAGIWPSWFGTASAICTCVLVIPIVTVMAQKLGKKTAFIISQSISMVGYLLFWFTFRPGNPYLMFLPLPLFAFGIGGLFTIMMSMTADICDLDELNTGERREGVFGAVYWWMVKFGFALSAVAYGWILDAAGFAGENNGESSTTILRLAYILVPIGGTLIAILVMLTYDLDESRARDIRKQLDDRKAANATTPTTATAH